MMTSGLMEFQRIGRISASKQQGRFGSDLTLTGQSICSWHAGIRVDDDLARHQQQERKSLDSDSKQKVTSLSGEAHS